MDSPSRILVIALVVLMVAVNLFFRYRIFRLMRILAKNKVTIRNSDLLDRGRREQLMNHHPGQAQQIEDLARNMRISLFSSLVLIVCLLIVLFILNR